MGNEELMPGDLGFKDFAENPPPIESDPAKYTIVVKKYTPETFRERLKFYEETPWKRWAICINTDKNEIYIGDDHTAMFQDIPQRFYVGGIVTFDIKNKKVDIEVLYDSRAIGSGEVKDQNVLDAIKTKLKFHFVE